MEASANARREQFQGMTRVMGVRQFFRWRGWSSKTSRRVASDFGSACGRTTLLLLLMALFLTSLRAQSSSSSTAEVQRYLARGEAALRAKDPVTAAREFRKALALDPKNTEAYTDLGIITFFQGNFRQASTYLRKALSLNPSLAKAEALLGMCETRMGESSGVELLAKAFPKVKDKPVRVQVGLELAAIYYRRGSLDSAAAVMQSLMELAPDNIEVLYLAQRVYYDLADDTLNKLALLAPRSALMQEVIAERLVNNGDLRDAIKYYKKALQADPRLPGVHFELGEALLESSPNDPLAQAAAEKQFAMAIQMDGDSPDIECLLGQIALQRANLKSAYVHFERASAMDHASGQAQLGLGKVLMSEGKPQEAIPHLREAVQSSPLNGEARYQLGMAYRDLNMPEKSRHELKLFHEIREAKAQVRQLFREMNKSSLTLDEELSGAAH